MKVSFIKSHLIFFGVIVFICIGGFFTAVIPFDKRLVHVSSVSILFFALPSYFALIKWLGKNQGLKLLFTLSLFALSIETFAILTGFPYGNFSYSEKIGLKLFETTPWTVPFAWVPLVLGTMSIAQKITNKPISIIMTSTLLLLCTDFVLDPGAVILDFWKYDNGGFFYNVPLSNFFGWIISGLIGSFIYYFFTKSKTSLPSSNIFLSYFFILLFWTNIAIWKILILPGIIGISLLFLLTYYSLCKKL